MTYLIGAILVVLLIALVLVFRPPRKTPSKDVTQQEVAADGAKTTDDQLDLDIDYEEKRTVEDEEELVLTFDEPDGAEFPETSSPEESEELDLVLDEPVQSTTDTSETLEDLDLDLDEADSAGGEISATPPSDSGPGEESIELTEEKGRDELDEDIPFIDDGDGTYERKGEMAPALADIPDGYAQVEEDEPPGELAERLEYFLGKDDEETELETEQPVGEESDDTVMIKDESETVDETVESEQVVEAEPVASPDSYGAQLQEQIERLRSEMSSAIENRETTKLGILGVALENLCTKQADISASFQAHQQVVDELKGVMSQLNDELPGFQLETAQNSLQKGDFDVVRSLLTEASGQLDNSPQLASDILYQWGRIEEENGDFVAALEIFTKACERDEENLSSMAAAGRLARITGDTENALLLLEKRVAAGQEKQEESVALAMTEHELAKVLTMEDKEKERVEELLIHARAIMEKILGAEHSNLGPVLHDLAVLHDSEGRYEQAEPLYTNALELIEKGLGSDSPRLGTTLSKLAGLYEELEMDEKSESLYNRALEIRKNVLGEKHPDVGSIMGHLANLLKMKGKYDQAEPMYRKSLEIAEVALGKDHPNLAVVLNDMAELYGEMGDEKQAEHFQERAFALFELPGMGDGFVEMEKDTVQDENDDKDQTIAGS